MTRWLAAALVAFTVGCGSTQVVRTALHGDLTSLKREVSQARAAGKLDRDTVERLARAVAGREVRSARGNAATLRIEQVRNCARSLLPVLRDRAKHLDDAGAEATLVLLELGAVDPARLVDKYGKAPDAAWRAVAVRTATLPAWTELRRDALLDPDERVRRASIAAELVRPARENLEALLEAARLDPDPQLRSRATQAVGVLGGQRAVFALKDHLARADDTTRTSIVRAWAEPASLGAGGREELLYVAEQPSGVASVVAADELARLAGPEAGRGRALLAHFIAHGTDEQKSEAMLRAPLGDADVVEALHEAAKSHDGSTAVVALARLTELRNERHAVLARLQELARGNDSVALSARVALAAAGDRSVAERLRTELGSQRARQRKLAAIGLYWLGDTANAAMALADDDPGVRTDVACAILAGRNARK
jgi:hypothetical protein